MAVLSTNIPFAETLRGALRARLGALSERRRKAREYSTIYSELSSLSDRDLADLGLTRFMLHDVARDAVYR